MSIGGSDIQAEGGWFWLANWFVDEHMVAVGGGPTRLYLALIRHGNGHTRQVSISVGKLSATLKSNRRTIFRWIEVLEAHKLIRRDSRHGGDTNFYLILPVKQTGIGEQAPPDDKLAPGSSRPAGASRAVRTAEPSWKRGRVRATKTDGGTSATGGPHTTSRVTFGNTQGGTGVTHYKEDNTSQHYKQEEVLVAGKPATADPQALPDLAFRFEEPLSPKDPVLWKELIQEIDVAWSLANNNQKCPWGPLALRRLKDAIKSAAGWGHSEWSQCVRNRFQSDTEKVNLGESPETFAPRLKDFFAGPRNRWGGVLQKGQDEPPRTTGKPVTFEQQRRANNDRAFAEAKRMLRTHFAGQ